MSSFSRGCMIRGRLFSRPTQSSPSLTFIAQAVYKQPRTFSSTQFLFAKAKKPTKIPPPPKPVAKATPASLGSSSPKPKLAGSPRPKPNEHRDTFANELSKLPGPTLLYEAPSHTGFLTVTYIGTTFFFLYGSYCLYTWCNPPLETPTWVALTFGTGGMIMVSMGTWLMLGPSGLIKTITAMPKSVIISKRLLGPQGIAKLPNLAIELEMRKPPIPFIPNRKWYIAPSAFMLPHALCPPVNAAQQRQLREAEVLVARHTEEQKEYERTHPVGKYARWMSIWFFGVFINFRRSWTRDGFMKVQVRLDENTLKNLKLDISGGEVLDGGRGIDRLVTINPRMLK